VSVTWTGLEELRGELRALPATLASRSHSLVKTAADTTERELRSGYPEKTGLMKARIYQREREGSALYAIDVVSGAPHAHLWEAGTVDRVTHAGHRTGRVLAHPAAALPTIAAPQQAALTDQLITLVEAAPAVDRVLP
jgi:hypothetical protein